MQRRLILLSFLVACAGTKTNGGTTGGSSTGGTSTGATSAGSTASTGSTTGSTAGTTTSGATTGATSGGLFTNEMPWTVDVSAFTPATQSATIISTLQGVGGWGGGGDFQLDLSIRILQMASGTPMQSFTPRDRDWAQAETGDPDNAEFYSPDCVPVPWPVPAGGGIEGEGETNYDCDDTGNDGDCHLIVVDKPNHKLYEMWRASISGGGFLGGCAVIWDLAKPYDGTLRGQGCTSADAAGFPIAAMLVTADEVASGEVKHALRFALPNSRIRRFVYTPPATHSTFATTGNASMPPYGARFRLRADYPEAGYSAGAVVVLKALKKYGMFMSDGGEIPLMMANDVDSTAKWDDLGITPQTFGSIQVSDFAVVDLGTLRNYDVDDDGDCHLNP